MADIVLNVEVRERTGTGGSRAARREGKVPGVLYGGPRGAVPIAVNANEFRKALYTGKLLGHLVKLQYGQEIQPVIAKDVQFDPVSDAPVHFDLYRVDEHQLVRINVPVHFRNQEASPGLKRGGVLNAVRHEVELWAPADSIPEELVVDLTGLEIGETVRISAVKLPENVEPTITDRDFVIATIGGRGAETADTAEAEPAEA
ncbi:MAG TPA: 50S ribosomal protein L25/general stress protein Ctc [Caulobacteraceae bacterium]|nr:50S ribosomal protein L25/general stress protein Ctc [Caulobacteraceae bacterium]